RAFTSSLGGIFEAVTADDRQRQCNEQGQPLAAHRLKLRDRQREQPDEQSHQRDDDTPRFEREQQGVDDRTALRFVHAPPPVSRTDSFSNQATRSASWRMGWLAAPKAAGSSGLARFCWRCWLRASSSCWRVVLALGLWAARIC